MKPDSSERMPDQNRGPEGGEYKTVWRVGIFACFLFWGLNVCNAPGFNSGSDSELLLVGSEGICDWGGEGGGK